MPRLPSHIYAGAPVWARTGAYGWREAIVMSIGPKFIRVTYPDMKRPPQGIKEAEEIVRRDPAANGKDRPKMGTAA